MKFELFKVQRRGAFNAVFMPSYDCYFEIQPSHEFHSIHFSDIGWHPTIEPEYEQDFLSSH